MIPFAFLCWCYCCVFVAIFKFVCGSMFVICCGYILVHQCVVCISSCSQFCDVYFYDKINLSSNFVMTRRRRNILIFQPAVVLLVVISSTVVLPVLLQICNKTHTTMINNAILLLLLGCFQSGINAFVQGFLPPLRVPLTTDSRRTSRNMNTQSSLLSTMNNVDQEALKELPNCKSGTSARRLIERSILSKTPLYQSINIPCCLLLHN